jgi:hypothetical protein
MHRQEICKALGMQFTEDMVTNDFFLGLFNGQQLDRLDSLGLINRGFCPLCGIEPIGETYFRELSFSSAAEFLCKQCYRRTKKTWKESIPSGWSEVAPLISSRSTPCLADDAQAPKEESELWREDEEAPDNDEFQHRLHDERLPTTFLFRFGAYIVYFIFLAAIIVGVMVSFIHFSNGRSLLGIWSLCSIFLLPKATLGLILAVEHKHNSAAWMNMPTLFWQVFPRTMRRYRDLLPLPRRLQRYSLYHSLYGTSAGPLWMHAFRDLFWFVIGTIPIIAV